MLQNEEASVKYCQVKLDEISKTLMESISAGTFSVPGGYELYRKAKERFPCIGIGSLNNTGPPGKSRGEHK